MSKLKAEIDEGRQRIEALEQQVVEAKAGTAAALHRVNVQTRYASRVQNVVRSNPPSDSFMAAMEKLIDDSRNALMARGK